MPNYKAGILEYAHYKFLGHQNIKIKGAGTLIYWRRCPEVWKNKICDGIERHFRVGSTMPMKRPEFAEVKCADEIQSLAIAEVCQPQESIRCCFIYPVLRNKSSL